MSAQRVGRLPFPEGFPVKREGVKFSGRRPKLVTFKILNVTFKEAVVLHATYRDFQVVLVGPGPDGIWKGFCDDFPAEKASVTVGHDPQEAFQPIKSRIDEIQGPTA